MSESRTVADQAARDRALDPERSFIVQAPAGSGKTGLLTLRYLTLLARAAHPEEVVAITFTRKAANEMRDRVLRALDEARTSARPGKDHHALMWDLARTVLERDIALGWHLALNPERLSIFTIDSFCSALARQMPYLSRFGAPPVATAEAERFHLEAAQGALAHLHAGDEWSEKVARLLRHLDNNLPRTAGLLATMLARRDQWLRHVVDGRPRSELRAQLEATLADINRTALRAVTALAPGGEFGEIAELARYASEKLGAQPNHPVHDCAELAGWPGTELGERPQWEGLAALLLTAAGSWFKTVNVKNGFPPKAKGGDAAENERRENMKARMLALLARLQEVEEFRAALAAIRILPPARYDDASWEALDALIEVLVLAVAELRLVFTQRGEADFIEITQGALTALGTSEAPTDLALHLDYRIHHLLVDEFQDTSLSQCRLLELLTAGWQPGDGRTLFVVGDPMQSIYRFRQAEVGLYLGARHRGIGGVKLDPLTLRVNFRSRAAIVSWVNTVFAALLPAREDAAAGAVPFESAIADQKDDREPGVTVHAFVDGDSLAEARRAVELVSNSEEGAEKIAILVRSRTHLAEIGMLLKERGLRFQAVEIEALAERPVVQDLLALTHALTHLADRAAWLAVLRAPWCGLTLADLESLAAEDPEAVLWERMRDGARLARMSADGRTRLARTSEVLAAALAAVGHEPLRRVVEGAWLALGGGACLEGPTDLDDARVYLELLDELDDDGLADRHRLAERMERLFARPDALAPDRLQLMTIHKAKGLEFDVVILPGLGRRPRGDSPPILRWTEAVADAQGCTGVAEGRGARLLLAPIRATGAEHDLLYNYIGASESEKNRHEDGRLLYVAATRARRHLHLIGSVSGDGEGGPRAPDRRSLLALLWPQVESDFAAAARVPSPPPAKVPAAPAENLRRLVRDFRVPAPRPAVSWQAGALPPLPDELPAVEFDWASETIRHVGTVVHQGLQQIGREGLARWDAARIEALGPGFRLALARRGVPEARLAEAVERVREALERVLNDQRGRWLFDPAHREARSEYGLSLPEQGQVVTAVMDRTFVDERGVRWIVDFKTSTHAGGGLDEFLDREQERYSAQLERYAAVMRRVDSRPVRLGLYFPLLSAWREWMPAGRG